MQLQVELYNNGKRIVRWFKTCCENDSMLKPGRRLILEEDFQSWTIIRTFVCLTDETELPPKARKATLLFFDEGDGQDDLKAAFPQIFVF